MSSPPVLYDPKNGARLRTGPGVQKIVVQRPVEIVVTRWQRNLVNAREARMDLIVGRPYKGPIEVTVVQLADGDAAPREVETLRADCDGRTCHIPWTVKFADERDAVGARDEIERGVYRSARFRYLARVGDSTRDSELDKSGTLTVTGKLKAELRLHNGAEAEGIPVRVLPVSGIEKTTTLGDAGRGTLFGTIQAGPAFLTIGKTIGQAGVAGGYLHDSVRQGGA